MLLNCQNGLGVRRVNPEIDGHFEPQSQRIPQNRRSPTTQFPPCDQIDPRVHLRQPQPQGIRDLELTSRQNYLDRQ